MLLEASETRKLIADLDDSISVPHVQLTTGGGCNESRDLLIGFKKETDLAVVDYRCILILRCFIRR